MNEIHKEFEINKLRKLGHEHSVALKNLVQLEESKKILRASLMKEYQLGPTGKPNSVAQQEAHAYADERYTAHIKALADATQIEAELKWQKRCVEINLELIKVQSFNQNQEKKAYNI